MGGSTMQSKTVLITGATDGIGKQAAKELAKMGAKIVLVGRNEEKCIRSVEEVSTFGGNSSVNYLLADLSSMGEVKKLAEEFRSKYDRLDVLINNAGAAFLTRQVTVDGFEKTFATNHLAYFLLTASLLEMLKSSSPSRIINVSSNSHYNGKIRFDDPHLKRFYFVMLAYSQSKLANVMHTYALARRLEGSGVTANCLHPGLVRTGIFRKVKGVKGLIEKILLRRAITVEEGAETLVYLASSEDVTFDSGNFYYKKKVRTSSARSYDIGTQERLWEMSEDMLKPWLETSTSGES
jgi:NAD(P)-dependent dehydrogenase (short-subunit alcohol dehydrogenase family)